MNRSLKILLVVYFLSLSMSVLYLHNFSASGPVVYFSFLGIWSIILVGIVAFDSDDTRLLGVVVAISVVLLIRYLYKPYPPVLVGPDMYSSLHDVRLIASLGRISGHPYPGAFILGAVMSKISGVSVFTVVQWGGSFLSVLAMVFVYLAGRELYDSRSGLLALVFVGQYPRFVRFHTSFVKETVGIVAIFLLLFALLKIQGVARRKFGSWVLLISLLVVATTISHHLSGAIMLALVGIYGVAHHESLPLSRPDVFRPTLVLLVSVYVVILGSWVLENQSLITVMVQQVVTILQGLTGSYNPYSQPPGNPGRLFGEPWATLQQIAMSISYIIGPLFALIASVAFFKIPSRRRNVLWLVVFGGTMAVLSIAFTVIIGNQGSGIPWGGRFVVYGLAALVVASSGLLSRGMDRSTVRRSIVAFACILLIVQGFGVPASLYTSGQPVTVDKAGYYSLPSEVSAVTWTIEHKPTPRLVYVDVWLHGNSVDQYSESTLSRVYRLRECTQESGLLVTSSNALPNEPACEYPESSKIYHSGTSEVML